MAKRSMGCKPCGARNAHATRKARRENRKEGEKT